MNQDFRHRQFPAGNPLANALVVVVGAVVIGVSFVLGVVALVALAAALLVFGAIIAVRVWWFNRRATARQKSQRNQTDQSENGRQVIEGEFRVVEAERVEDRDPEK